ncbi:hypothetical protein ASG40_16725 [Methylobacterium sp. Leaf399]|uniref:DUF6111 family protein n=1 Tax=unclassified Methylobacterium TaxID=2615210 RepID=UPI0006F29609|nr:MULTISPECIES: DUF6111 family protein [unclassified Methylobacterium]KQP59150.1 hypothetical protein ASF39_16970 [Methylobacterium sp. Leaf108]KQT18705.1 hypothetical protein ASG40_16725 [Methylobacterium sp. Leaf399]KQT88817.1 hypothetical protein ASG59_14595 [Methylobacterium sp. Leaf466]
MIARIVQEALLFLLPWALFYGYLALKGRNPHQGYHWEGQVFRLFMAGIGLVVVSLVLTGLFGESHRGGYVPPRLENGQVVPGTFR